jgi:hypothetical protein
MLSINSQTIERIEINGVILVHNNDNDVEGVTIYNTSSSKGTITNSVGEFVIEIAVNDIIEVSALQFESILLTITEEVIENKTLKIYLVEQMNQLDAVLLSQGLSGNLVADVVNVKEPKYITIDMGNMDASFEYNDEKAFDSRVVQNHLTSIINPEARDYLPDLVKIIALFTKKKINLSFKKNLFANKEYEKPIELIDIYSHNEISEIFNISINKVEAFIAFVEAKGISKDLLNDANEMQRIEFLVKQSKLFLKTEHAKN